MALGMAEGWDMQLDAGYKEQIPDTRGSRQRLHTFCQVGLASVFSLCSWGRLGPPGSPWAWGSALFGLIRFDFECGHCQLEDLGQEPLIF